jgi:DNA-binding transcriptional regulator YiaG
MKGGVRRFKDRLKEDMKNPEFRKAFEQEEVFASLAIEIAKIRQSKKLTQKQLARKLHTTQQNVSRLEDVQNRGYSIETLVKIADAFDKRLKIIFV